jgi:Tol biopolymer transport system component
VGSPGTYSSVALSPDGKRVAVDLTDAMGNQDVWVLDVARGNPTRFTFDTARDLLPVWSPDGTKLAFSSDRAAAIANYDIYQKDSSGSGNEQLVLKSGRPNGWSPDGRYLLYERRPKTKWDLWVLPMSPAGDRKPTPYLETPSDKKQGQFSPDGRWIAYASDESGAAQFHVFVQSFPAGAGKFQVSTGAGGVQPRWRRDGKELFYIATDGRLMAVEAKTANRFEYGAPQALFNPRIPGGGSNVNFFGYDVAADGKRFLVNTVSTAAENAAPAPITVVLNWQRAAAH